VERRFHPEKEADNDIFESAVSLSEESLQEKSDRTRLYPAIDLWTEGFKALPDNISHYNAKRTARWETATIEREDIERNSIHGTFDVEAILLADRKADHSEYWFDLASPPPKITRGPQFTRWISRRRFSCR
jgi:hypothetical protein